MSVEHELAVPKLHERLRTTRYELEDMTALARELAEALAANVDLRYGVRVDDLRVKFRTRHALRHARARGVLE